PDRTLPRRLAAPNGRPRQLPSCVSAAEGSSRCRTTVLNPKRLLLSRQLADRALTRSTSSLDRRSDTGDLTLRSLGAGTRTDLVARISQQVAGQMRAFEQRTNDHLPAPWLRRTTPRIPSSARCLRITGAG